MNAFIRRFRADRRRVSVTTLGALALFAVACSDVTGSTPGRDLAQHRAQWDAAHVSSYQFDFHQTGYFIACTGPTVRVQVTAGAVVGATDLATGQSVGLLACWPTIDQLFDRAAAAEQAGAITSIAYDATLGYPTYIEIAGVPDASGAYFASNVRPNP